MSLFYFAAAAGAYFLYINTYKEEKQAENKASRDHHEGGILIDVNRAQVSMRGIQEGSDEIIRTKLKRGLASLDEVKKGIEDRRKLTVGLTKRHMQYAGDRPKRLTYVSPTDDMHSPNMTALSGWYLKAVGNTAPVVNPSLQTN